MTKYKLILDESGNFDNDFERYIIIGGVFFKSDDEEELSKYFMPIHKRLCEILDVDELHASSSSKSKKIMDCLFSHIGMNDKIKAIVYIIDKHKSYIYDLYDKKSFKYNKAIEWLLKDMAQKGVINISRDEIEIKIDNINIKKEEARNWDWLPTNFKFVKKIIEVDSKNVICIQLADYIVNSFSKNDVFDVKSIRNQLLNPIILTFLKNTEEEYLIQK